MYISFILAQLSLTPLSKPTTRCFAADDGGGRFRILYNAVRDYMSQDCPNNNNCTIAQTYG